MNSYTYLAKVAYWNSCESKEEYECLILHGASNYAEAVAKLEDFYAEDLLEFDIKIYDTPLPVLNIELYDTLRQALEEKT